MTGLLLLAVYWLMVAGYFPTNGLFSKTASSLVLAAWVVAAVTHVLIATRKLKWTPPPVAALNVSLAATVALAYYRYGVNIHSWYGFKNLFLIDVADMLRMLVLGVALTYLIPFKPPFHFDALRFGTLLLLTFALKFTLLSGMSTPGIDLFVMNQRGCQYLTEGKNPFTPLKYLEEMPDVPGNLPEGTHTFVYPPGVLLMSLPGWLAVGDVRYVFPVLDVAIIVLWLSLGRFTRATQCLLLMYLLSPQGSFMLFQGYTDPMIATWLSLTALLMQRKRLNAAYLVLGGALATKLQALPFLMAAIRCKLPSEKQLALAAAGFLLPCLPFAWNNGAEFVRHMTLALRMGPRPDALNLANLIPSVPVGTIVLTGLALTGLAWLIQKGTLADYLEGNTFYLLTLFFFGKWAFVNYYWLIGASLLLTLLVCSAQHEPHQAEQGEPGAGGQPVGDVAPLHEMPSGGHVDAQ